MWEMFFFFFLCKRRCVLCCTWKKYVFGKADTPGGAGAVGKGLKSGVFRWICFKTKLLGAVR